MKIQIFCICKYFLLLVFCCDLVYSFREFSRKDIRRLREEVRQMFQHAYNGYLKYASGYDELRPLSCDGINTWGSYSLTLIDALDTLAVMGNYSEFRRVVKLITEKSNFDADINVSVFETNIRIVGGLLSAHLMSERAGLELEPSWPCSGPLLRLAEDVAKRLLPAFDTKTGMPYGTVNLRYGVPSAETSVTCTAGVGTFIVEFGTLSRLTGNSIYEEVALNAIYALWSYRSPIGLFGNHIDVQTGRWTAQDSGIGAGVDSFYEYLVKGAILLNRPELLKLFNEGRKAIDKYLRKDDWHVWVGMNKGQVTLPVFQSLEAYWPGVLSLVGETSLAMRTLHNYHSVWKQYGFLPEFYNIPNGEASTNRENYPLRPELIESVMYLYRATKDPYLLEVGEDILASIQYSAKTPCGYATIKNVRDHRKEDRMESFFLAETTKYLYLLFDEKNFLHNTGEVGTKIHTLQDECVIDAGGYVFNTEAHPIDPSALDCCHDKSKHVDFFVNFNREDFVGESLKTKRQMSENDENEQGKQQQDKCEQNSETVDNKSDNGSSPKEAARKIAMEVIKNFDKIEIEFRNEDIEKNLPSFITKNHRDASETQKPDSENKKNEKHIKIDNILKEFDSLEDQKFKWKFIETNKLMKMQEEQLSKMFHSVENLITIQFNITFNSNDEQISTADFWNTTPPSSSSSDAYSGDMLERMKYIGQYDICMSVIENLSKLQEIYYKTTLKELKTEYLLNKILEYLTLARYSSDAIKMNEIINDEIDRKIYEIMLDAQKKFEIKISFKAIDIQLYKFLLNIQNIDYYDDIEHIAKRIKQAEIIRSELANNTENKFMNLTLKSELFDFLEKRIKLQINYKLLLSAQSSNSSVKDSTMNLSQLVTIKTTEHKDNYSQDEADEYMLLTSESLKKRLKEQNDAANKLNSNKDQQSTYNGDDDIIVVKDGEFKTRNKDNSAAAQAKDDEEKVTGIGSVEQINLDDLSTSSLLEIEIDKNKQDNLESTQSTKDAITTASTPSAESFDQTDEVNNKNSIISEFVRTILRTAMPSNKSFNPDELLLRIRENGRYLNKTQNYELFHCRAQPFLNRFALRGQFFDDDND